MVVYPALVVRGVVPPAPGLYVGFTIRPSDNNEDPFGRDDHERLLYNSPNVLSPSLSAFVDANGDYFAHLLIEVLYDIDGFLLYVLTCLNVIYRTVAGRALLEYLGGPSGRIITIIPARLGWNKARANNEMRDTMSPVAYAVREWNNIVEGVQEPLSRALNRRYNNIPEGLPRYSRLANDLNDMPLYSLFTVNNPPPEGADHFLRRYLRVGRRLVSGQNLQNWFNGADLAAANDLMHSNAQEQNVLIKRYFLLALIFALYSPDDWDAQFRGPGTGTDVFFNVCVRALNDRNFPYFRPPAIGLAHELIHAMYNAMGTQPGIDVNDYTTTAAELLAVGLGPFADRTISENALRAQWAALNLPPAHPNYWANPQPRSIYTPPGVGQTVAALRITNHCI